ncbi:hypothetical protein [Nostoc sp.]|uniref:hypothetical protein n=1 Tax=Nostoc sp. TaxID=1180 RepID=UPI002FF7DCC9
MSTTSFRLDDDLQKKLDTTATGPIYHDVVMNTEERNHKKNQQMQQTSAFSHVPAQGMFESRPFAVQSKNNNSEQPNLKTSLIQAEKYGHHLSKINLTNQSAPTAVQTKPDTQPIQLADSYRYLSNQNKNNYQLGNQINHGPGMDLDDNQKQNLQQHYGPNSKVLDRLSQYNDKHKTYVKAAQNAGRQLTDQEVVAARTGTNAPDASINHIIASGTGQNIINHETLRFNQGLNTFNQGQGQSQKGQPQIRLGIAEQAASVGRVQGHNRAIINERDGEFLNNNSTDKRIYGKDQAKEKMLDVDTTRNRALTHTLTAFQGEDQQRRYQAYRDVLKMTFDSPGNLRVGDDYGNNQVSTGFDAPLNKDGVPTDRANRLLAAHQTYAPDRLLTDDNNPLFSHDIAGNRLSSSQIPDPQATSNPPLKRSRGQAISNPPLKRRKV